MLNLQTLLNNKHCIVSLNVFAAGVLVLAIAWGT